MTNPESKVTIKTPRGIRFECSMCGNCCIQWPVPLTDADYKRISSLELQSIPVNVDQFRRLASAGPNLAKFTHTLEKRPDGLCSFLDQADQCLIHKEVGEDKKPSLCRIFPYTFSYTPGGVFASLSFASTGVLINHGRLLSEQEDLLQIKFKQFLDLFPVSAQEWEGIQIIDGIVLTWPQYEALNNELEEIIYKGNTSLDTVPQAIPRKLLEIAELTCSKLDDKTLYERDLKLECRPKIADQLILNYLDQLYFPENPFLGGSGDLKSKELLTTMVAAPNSVSIGQGHFNRRFQDLIKLRLGSLDQKSEELFDRFFYARFFSKLFFGPGFHGLSLIAGLHHLQILYVLLRLKIKALTLNNKAELPDFLQIVEVFRNLERRLSQLSLSRESVATLEVLLSSHSRAQRIGFLAE